MIPKLDGGLSRTVQKLGIDFSSPMASAALWLSKPTNKQIPCRNGTARCRYAYAGDGTRACEFRGLQLRAAVL